MFRQPHIYVLRLQVASRNLPGAYSHVSFEVQGITKNIKNASLLVRIPYDSSMGQDLYSEQRGRELFRSLKCAEYVEGAELFDSDTISELNDLWSPASNQLLESYVSNSHPITNQILWPSKLLKVNSDFSSVQPDVFSKDFSECSSMVSLGDRIVVAIAPRVNLISRSFLDAILMFAAGRLLDQYVSDSKKSWLDTGNAVQLLRQHFRVVYYDAARIESDRQFDKLGHYLDTALLRMSDRYCRALRRDDDKFLNKFKASYVPPEQVAH